MPLNKIRKEPAEIKQFLKEADINADNFHLYEKMLDYRDDVFVSVFNSLVDEKITIEDTNSDLAQVWHSGEADKGSLNPFKEGKSKLLEFPKDMMFASKDGISIYDKTKSPSDRETAVEISNLSQTLSNSLTKENKIDDPYTVLHRDKFKEDFKKAATLSMLLSKYPEKDSPSRYYNSGLDILELFIPDFQDIYNDYLSNQPDFNEFSFFNRFSREVFLPEGFSFSYSEVVDGVSVQRTHTVKHSDLAVISDSILTEVITTKDQ